MKHHTQRPARDLYQETTDRIIAAIEAGAAPWRCDWLQSGLPRRSTGQTYRGVNILLLGMSAAAQGFTNPHWITFKQAQELGGNVRKGEKGTGIIFFKTLARDAEEGDKRADENGQIHIPCLKGYTVFNVEQCEGLPASRFPAPAVLDRDPLERDHWAEAAMRSCGAVIREGGEAAFYLPAMDYVQLPDFQRFRTVPGFLATMAHELVHWTGAKHRLARDQEGGFGSLRYAAEELVAEIGAAFIGARLGFVGDHIESHAGYIDHWLKILRGDKRAIFRAAAAAQAAADLVLQKADPADFEHQDEAEAAPTIAQLALL